MSRSTPRNVVIAALAVFAIPAMTVNAAITATPNIVSAFPTQTTASITLNMTFPSAPPGTTGTISVVGLPAGATTAPSLISYSFPAGSVNASASFTFSIGGGTAPGTYPITLTDSNKAGAVNVTLTVNAPSFKANASPNPLTLTVGGAPQPVVVSTTPDPGYSSPTINYAFSGLPGFVLNNGPMGTTITGNYGPVTFTFSLGSAAVAGTYTGTLTGTDVNGNSKLFPFTVVVVQPDIGASFAQPVVAVCNGQSTNDSVLLSPVNGYSGTPTVSFTSIPAGIMITPSPLAVAAMPPGQTIPFSVAASGASSGIAMLSISDATVGISKTIQLQINVGTTNFTPSVAPASITLSAGGAAQPLNASIAATSCLSGNVIVTATGQPSGITIISNPSTILAPAFAPVSISLQASAATPQGTYPITFTFTSGAFARSQVVQVNVSAGPDFTLNLNPSAVTIQAGSSGTTSATITPINNFNAAVSVTAPTAPGVTITPATFTLLPGSSQLVTIAVAPGTTPGALSLAFTGTAPGVIGVRTATLQATISAVPGFILMLAPDSLTIAAGGTATVGASVVPLNGFSGIVTVTAPSLQGISFSPPAFTIAPGGRQVVTISVDPTASPGSRGPQLFQASSPGVANGQGATLTLTISGRPDFSISVTPPSVTIRSGSSTTVIVSASGVNGFTGPITVSAPTIAGLGFAPSNFTLNGDASQQVTVSASPPAVGRGPLQAIFTGTAANAQAAHQATVIVTVLPPLPILTAAAPPSLVVGAQSSVVRVAGDFLQPGARFQSSDPTLIVEASNVLTAQLADVRMSVRSSAAPGPRSLSVTNPDGGESPTPLTILLYPTSSIAAPLDVLAAAIVFPAQGTMLAATEGVYPRGLLATAGTGTIVGSWQFDGVPFDRFVVNAAGGMPVEVRTNVPIPASFAGSHTLGIVVESPRKFVSPVIEVVDSVERVSRLTLLAPREGAIIQGKDTLFRWSLMPNCSGYDIEVALPGLSELPDELTPMRRFHVAGAEWKPSAADVAAMGPGIHRWRVRPRCSGDTALEPSGWQRFAILPEHVDISLLPMTTNDRGARVIHWKSGVTGLLYRVEFLSQAGETIFSALTSSTEYAIPRTLPSGTVVRVRAIAPDGSILGSSSVSSPLSRIGVREGVRLADQTLIEFGTLEPADGATVSNPQPHIAAQWKGSAPKDQIMFLVDDTDITQVATVAATSVAYDSLIALAPGSHSVALAVAGNVKRWTFTIPGAEATAAQAPAAPAPPPAQQPRGDWVIAPVGTITLIRDGSHDVRTQFSALTDLMGDALSDKATGDVSLRHNFENNQTVQESRNWITDFGAHQGPNPTESARVGFAPPDFFDQAQLLSAGLPRGGVQAKLATPIGSVSYYQTFTSRPAGLVTGLFGPDQKLKGGAYQIPLNNQWDFRIVGLHVSEAPDVNSAGGQGRALGIFARYTLGTALNAIVEGAHGDFTPSPGSLETRRKGNAYRLGLLGVHGTLNYALNFRRTQANFVNPANRAFTPAGVPDRTGGDLTIGKLIGTTSISVQLRHLQDGTTSGLLVPRTKENGGMASLMKMLTPHVSLALSGNLTRDKGDEKPEIDLPRADRSQSGGTGTLSELFGRFNFSQTLSRQSLRDHVNNLNDSTTTVATLTSGGQLTAHLNLSGVLSGTRSAGSPIVGRTDQYLASLQPLITVPPLFLTLQPRASYSTSKNDLFESKTTTEDYLALVTFAPQWFNSIVTIQVSGDWSRNSVAGEATPAPFVHRYAATFNLHLREGAGPAYVQGALLPGIQPVAAPNPAASAPGIPK